MKSVWLLLFVMLIGCSGATVRSGALEEPWHLGFGAPAYMETWVETASVIDVKGGLYPNAGSGTVSLRYSGDPSGWPDRPGRGAGRNVTGADLPARIYVRWQSLVEPQTYEVTLEIPDEVRRLMQQREPQPRYLPEQKLQYRNQLIVGLAPGGAVKVWNSGVGLEPVEVMCSQASVVSEGPSQGKTGGAYAYSREKLEPATQHYLNEHPIPYESWKCGNG
ncbi:DUF2931 family protein [Luteimonas abyssi]|uniref:DUF2931 family protein n=1 Tax=Luteimonas abyssi TaxID=1247514 RepID=UPI000B1BDB10|nr:DUF2931 family protein [Luteimonas abyssi]